MLGPPQNLFPVFRPGLFWVEQEGLQVDIKKPKGLSCDTFGTLYDPA
jgi:hypothetical protein